ncbi:hypothetical protein JXA88_01970 [Candidatus Fermentibacteria bacterium]|nr:hypothetical protein [Candidatus Fermentibacteria bacterium]
MRSLYWVMIAMLGMSSAVADHDLGFASKLPAETSFFVTTEHMGEVASAIAASEFYRAVYAIPSVAEAVEQGKFPDLVAKWDELVAGEQGPMVRAAASLLAREVVFASTGDGTRGIVPGIIQLARVALLAQEHNLGGQDRAVGDHLRIVASNVSRRCGLDPFVLAFRTQQRALLEPMVASLLTQLPPSIAPMVAVEELHGVQFTTLTVIPGLLHPPQNLRPGLIQMIPDSLALESVMAAYATLTLKVRLGWLDDYLVIVAEDQTGTFADKLARGPGATALAAMPEFQAVLSRAGDHPVRRAVVDLRGWRRSLSGQLEEVSSDLAMCRTLMGFAAMAGVTPQLIGEKLTEFAATSLDPELSVLCADLDHGVRMVGELHHAPESQACVMGAKTLTLASRIPASAGGWLVWGGPNAAEGWRRSLDEAVKWRSMPWMTLSMPAEQRPVQNKITELMAVTRDSLTTALGQEGMAVLSWEGVLTKIEDREVNLSIPEVAFVLEITDRDRIRSLGAVYEAKITELLAQRADSAVKMPKPSSKKVKDGEKLWWDGLIPVEGPGLVPTIYLTDHHLIAASSARLADEIYEVSRGKGKCQDWPQGELRQLVARSSSVAGVLGVAGMAPFLTSILDHARGASGPELSDKDMRATEDMAAALRLLQAIPRIWGHALIQGNEARLTARLEVHDLQ